jgi:mannan endo-1,4-beta-mannosidase
MKIQRPFFLLLTLLWFSTTSMLAQSPIDKDATLATRNLYKNLFSLMNNGKLLFGHQDDLAYGVGWRGHKKDSDIKRTVGDFPAVFGWDLGHIELNEKKQIDSVPFNKLRKYIKRAYRMGGINTISWHVHNPSSGGSAWDTSGMAVRSILPGGVNHDKFISWLDKVADFALSLKVGDTAIPVIFRPYHENTGSWFWWGEKLATPEEYTALWKMTVDYLRNRGVHNFLYAYSPDRFASKEHYLRCYPGDDYVDILGHDLYHQNGSNPESGKLFSFLLNKDLTTLTELSKERNKIIALTETGVDKVGFPNWWTSVLGATLKNYNLAYVLVWRNARLSHYFAPFPGQATAEDFNALMKDERLYMSKKLKQEKIYHPKP